MWCNVCGKEIADDSTFCHACGADLSKAQEVNETDTIVEPTTVIPPVYDYFRKIFSGNLFLVACILATVFAAGGVFRFSLDVVLDILCAVSFWLLRQSALNNNVTGYKTPLKILHVSSAITYVFLWVAVGLLALAGIITLVLGGVVIDQMNINVIDLEGISESMLAMGATVIGVLFLLFAVVAALLNVFCFGNFKKCAKSFVASVETGNIVIEKMSAVKAWLLVNAILETMSIFDGDWVVKLTTVASAAFFYVLFFWAREITKQQTENFSRQI